MDRTLCDQAHAALLQALTDERQPAQNPALADHVTRCPACQDLRAALLDQLLPGSASPADQCGVCRSDLAAYVDTVLDEGARNAATIYPHVWWHLAICRECAEIFAQTAALASAERAGSLPPLPMGRACKQ